MNFETIFSLSSLLVMPFWLLLIFLPRWRVTERLVAGPWLAVPAALLYAVLVLPRFGEVFTAVSNPTLAGITTLLASPAGATVAWVHFLAFDLFVARWVYLDGRSRKISSWFISPTLFMVLMLGPVGFLLYLVVRTAVAYQSPPTVSADAISGL
ncbi:MAG: DUF4281 domain-containing protein [Anaerolineales bacterium]|nr:DUF4281 domain-containing protein [Anaerolineales bacterium]MCB8936894.1 DUF4281 domain-containing protein [Ardenticatenaceae bacterium]